MEFFSEMFNSELFIKVVMYILSIVGVGWIGFLLKGKKIVSKIILYSAVVQTLLEMFEAMKLSVSPESAGGKRLTAEEMDMINQTVDKVKTALKEAGHDLWKDSKPSTALTKPTSKDNAALSVITSIGAKVIGKLLKK